MSLSWRWMISPTLTNEVRGGFMRSNTSFVDSNDYPKFLLSTTNLLFNSPVNTFLNQGRTTNTYSIQDNATWMKGKHEVSFGFQSQLLRTNPFNDAGIIPTYTLGISSANTTGLTAADLPGIRSSDLTTANNLYANLAGIVSTAAQTFNVTSTTSGFVPGATNLRQLTQSTWAGYVQDKWRVRPNLTLNIGVRYEYWTPLDERNSLFLAPRLQNNDVARVGDGSERRAGFHRRLLRTSVLQGRQEQLCSQRRLCVGSLQGRQDLHSRRLHDRVRERQHGHHDPQQRDHQQRPELRQYPVEPDRAAEQSARGGGPGLQGAAHAGATTTPSRPPPRPACPIRTWPRLTCSSGTSASSRKSRARLLSARYIGNKGSTLLRAIDYNQILYNANGFLADFQRAQNNAGSGGKAGPGLRGHLQRKRRRQRAAHRLPAA